jgi:hypothetical protein
VPADRVHDVSRMTDDELQRARRDLDVSLALAFPGSPVRERPAWRTTDDHILVLVRVRDR